MDILFDLAGCKHNYLQQFKKIMQGKINKKEVNILIFYNYCTEIKIKLPKPKTTYFITRDVHG